MEHVKQGAIPEALQPSHSTAFWVLHRQMMHWLAAVKLLYFAAGPDDETHGLFRVLTPVPEPPSTYAMMHGGRWSLSLLLRRRDLNAGKEEIQTAANAGQHDLWRGAGSRLARLKVKLNYLRQSRRLIFVSPSKGQEIGAA